MSIVSRTNTDVLVLLTTPHSTPYQGNSGFSGQTSAIHHWEGQKTSERLSKIYTHLSIAWTNAGPSWGSGMG